MAILTHSGLQAERKASCHGSKYCSASADPSPLIWCGSRTQPYLQFIDHNSKYNGEFQIIGKWTYIFLSCPFFPCVCKSLTLCVLFLPTERKKGGAFLFLFFMERKRRSRMEGFVDGIYTPHLLTAWFYAKKKVLFHQLDLFYFFFKEINCNGLEFYFLNGYIKHLAILKPNLGKYSIFWIFHVFNADVWSFKYIID